MLAIVSMFSRVGRILAGGGLPVLLVLTGCDRAAQSPPTVDIRLYQTWQLKRGDAIAGRQVLGGLGELSIDLNGASVYAPFNGRADLDKHSRCVIFSSPEIPAYLFRLCGLETAQMGELRQGSAIGSGNLLLFATLRKQANGTWAMVEPTKTIVNQILQKK